MYIIVYLLYRLYGMLHATIPKNDFVSKLSMGRLDQARTRPELENASPNRVVNGPT